ncbi:hypothetical protein ACPMJQ_05605 [Streptomyces pseudogriseolus]|uniref:hypothetical protein n=1 Tax=Streptomyces pseudogriseolus TaxID=36817 RepID=UPI003FA1B15E
MTAHDNSGDRDPFRKDAGGEGPGREGSGHGGTGREEPGREGSGRGGPGREGPGREGSGRGGPGREEPGREGSGREVSGREGPGREGSGRGGPGREEPGREGSGRGASGHNGPGREGPGREVSGHGGPGREDPGREGPGRGGSGREDPSHDALAAALFDEPPPEGAREDAAYLAARDAALADLAVLRVQLTLIGDALSGRVEAAPAAGERPEETGAAGPRPARTTPATPLRRRSRYRPLKVALGGLAAAAAAGLVLGLGWLVSQNGGATADSASRGGAAADAKEDTGAPAFGTPRYLACARLVAEGRVTGLEEVPGTGGVQRVTLRASRYYKGDGPVTFLRDDAEEVPLRPGDQVLVALSAGLAHPDRMAVGEADIAPVRAGIVAALPASRAMRCG